ncbi:hypothetical protein AN641_10240 [Candidatus Epulonipiscioides gigas]|nr:hypothetical protein AN641_10240 [Epulopiscium sp. SCG-C07WGA-EpuloA2]
MKRILATLIITFSVCVIGIFIWTNNTYELSSDITLPQYSSGSIITSYSDYIIYNPTNNTTNTGIIIYPGALVEPNAYSYYAIQLAKQGYLVAILDVTMNLSLLDTNKAMNVINHFPEISSWYVAGHSMGGVSATVFVNNNLDIVDGLILLASYPSSNINLSFSELKVLSIYGELDGLSTVDEINNSKSQLPTDTTFVEIKGGNHAQFGLYGEQKGDLKATISPLEQQDIIVKATLDFLTQK